MSNEYFQSAGGGLNKYPETMANMNMENFFRYQDPKAVTKEQADMIEMPTQEQSKESFRLPTSKAQQDFNLG